MDDIIFNNIRAEISRRRWSVGEFCDKLGVDRTKYYYWEKAKDFPASYLIKMTQVLGITADELLGLNN